MGARPDPDAVAEEQRRADRLRRTVDVTCALLRQGRLARADVFDLVLAPRFRRILDECCPRPGGRVLPFRGPSGSRR